MGQNQYQKRFASLQEVVERIRLTDGAAAPEILLSVSPCRSGTTVLLRVFGAAGIQAHYQELKNVYRWRMQAEEFSWQIPADQDRIYLKETLGPYTLAEARFNPLTVLLEAGIAPENLKVFIVGRSPIKTWVSWASWWHAVTDVDILVQAYHTVEAIRCQAQSAGLLAATFVYDAIRDAGAATAIQRLFAKLGLSFNPIAVQGWQKLPPFGEPDSNVILPPEPPVFQVENLHASVTQADGLSYFDRAYTYCEQYPVECRTIRQSGVEEIYERWRQACEIDLGILIQPVEK